MDDNLLQILYLSVHARRQEIDRLLYSSYEGIVQTGPFAGMFFSNDNSWGSGDISPKILGCYEQELHGSILKAIERRPEIVVNVGCAEGYYAVGLARALPEAKIYAVDTDEKARIVCAENAKANGVHVNMEIDFESNDLRDLASRPGRKLLIMDIEGGEKEFAAPALKEFDVIIECHDPIFPGTTDRLLEVLPHAEKIFEGPRDPNSFPPLQTWQSLDRWLAVNEGRAWSMHWLVNFASPAGTV